MKKIILASNNAHKIKEMKELLDDINVKVTSLKEESIEIDVVEDGITFEENAKKKATEIAKYLRDRGDKDFIVIADDSGLEVDCLNGKPGIYSARYAGEHGNDTKNNLKLLDEMKGIPIEKRGAQFVCQIALVNSNNEILSVRGEVRGRILDNLNSEGGFGYDPLFFYEPMQKTFDDMSAEEKNSVSHRGRALQELKDKINGFL